MAYVFIAALSSLGFILTYFWGRHDGIEQCRFVMLNNLAYYSNCDPNMTIREFHKIVQENNKRDRR